VLVVYQMYILAFRSLTVRQTLRSRGHKRRRTTETDRPTAAPSGTDAGMAGTIAWTTAIGAMITGPDGLPHRAATTLGIPILATASSVALTAGDGLGLLPATAATVTTRTGAEAPALIVEPHPKATGLTYPAGSAPTSRMFRSSYSKRYPVTSSGGCRAPSTPRVSRRTSCT
jgi:hypothetical protein